ncbi:MAG: hypothetical protein ACSHX6_12790 [Akkermansiaceae bacterium]
MLGNKVSQFIKRRYLVAPEGVDCVIAKDASQEFVKEEVPNPVVKSDPVAVAAPEIEPELTPEPVVELDQEMVDYEKSNQGRSYGWWVCLDGERVATLEYRCLLEEPVHLYAVNVLDDKFLRIDLDTEKWLKPNVTLQSRYAESYIKSGLSMAAVGNQMIVVEDLLIPETYFHKQYEEMGEFHDKLVEQAKSNSKG